ncbi:MAG: hypothetical protein SF339_19790 [Blastocatellia bacterium]|nr:hypothetical protein [Blastocatellia bacterium]
MKWNFFGMLFLIGLLLTVAPIARAQKSIGSTRVQVEQVTVRREGNFLKIDIRWNPTINDQGAEILSFLATAEVVYTNGGREQDGLIIPSKSARSVTLTVPATKNVSFQTPAPANTAGNDNKKEKKKDRVFGNGQISGGGTQPPPPASASGASAGPQSCAVRVTMRFAIPQSVEATKTISIN